MDILQPQGFTTRVDTFTDTYYKAHFSIHKYLIYCFLVFINI